MGPALAVRLQQYLVSQHKALQVQDQFTRLTSLQALAEVVECLRPKISYLLSGGGRIASLYPSYEDYVSD